MKEKPAPISGDSVVASILDKASEVLGFFDGEHQKKEPDSILICTDITRAGRPCQLIDGHEGAHHNEDDSLGTLEDEQRAETAASQPKPHYDAQGFPISKEPPKLPPFTQISAVMDGSQPILFGLDRAGGAWCFINGEWSPVSRTVRKP